METIFDHHPTKEELIDLRFDSLGFCMKFGHNLKDDPTEEHYKRLLTQKQACYDLYALFELRNEPELAKKYWKLYGGKKLLGFDYIQIEI